MRLRSFLPLSCAVLLSCTAAFSQDTPEAKSPPASPPTVAPAVAPASETAGAPKADPAKTPPAAEATAEKVAPTPPASTPVETPPSAPDQGAGSTEAASISSTQPEPAKTTPPSAASRSPTPAPAEPAAPLVVTATIDPALAQRLSSLEGAMVAQAQSQNQIYHETSRLLMFFGTACVAMGLVAIVAAVFLMHRTLASVSAITAQVAHSPAFSHGLPALPAPASLATAPPGGLAPSGFERVQASGQRFQSRMTSLEQRLNELENLATHDASSTSGDSPAPATRDEDPAGDPPPPAPVRVVPVAAILVRKAETLTHLGKLDEALATLDEAARLDGDDDDDDAEIHLARGRVMEKLGRLGDALKSYDRAVQSDDGNTNALLLKAGILNRQERFDEALTCYERALAVHRAAV